MKIMIAFKNREYHLHLFIFIIMVCISTRVLLNKSVYADLHSISCMWRMNSIIIYSDLDSVFVEVVQFWWLKCCVVMMM